MLTACDAGTGRRHPFPTSAPPLDWTFVSPINDHRRFARRHPSLHVRTIHRSYKLGPLPGTVGLPRMTGDAESAPAAVLDLEGGCSAFSRRQQYKKVPTRIAGRSQQTRSGDIGRMADALTLFSCFCWPIGV